MLFFPLKPPISFAFSAPDDFSEIGISVMAGYKYSSVQISMPIDYSFSIDHQAILFGTGRSWPFVQKSPHGNSGWFSLEGCLGGLGLGQELMESWRFKSLNSWLPGWMDRFSGWEGLDKTNMEEDIKSDGEDPEKHTTFKIVCNTRADFLGCENEGSNMSNHLDPIGVPG